MFFRNRRMKRDETQNDPDKAAEGAANEPAPTGAQPASQQDDQPAPPPEGEDATGDAQAQQQGPSMDDFSKLVAQLDQATAEAADYKDRFVRSVADFDNYRRRMTREKDDIRRAAAGNVVEAILPVVDNLALALESARKHHPEAAAVIDGVDMIYNQLRNVLKSSGVEELNPVGQPFDPNLHESIARQPSPDVPEGNVMVVTRIGYSLYGRLLRPASVVLSAGPRQQED